MASKRLKKSTMEQLRTLVLYMEENPELARSVPKLDVDKRVAEQEWKQLCNRINSLGPPIRSLSDWKKTWADLKSRTKKKILENRRSLEDDGGLLYHHSPLTELEQKIEKIYGMTAVRTSVHFLAENIDKSESEYTQSFDDDCLDEFLLVETPDTPPRNNTPIKIENTESENNTPPIKIENTEDFEQESDEQLPQSQQESVVFKTPCPSDSQNEQAGCSYGKRRKRTLDEQLASVRRQLRMVERSAALVKVDNAKRLADAAEAQAEAAKRNADAAEAMVASMKAIADSTQRIERMLEHYLQNTKNENT